MAFRIFACLILLASTVRATDSYWQWYPVNSEETSEGKVLAAYSGLKFYFTEPPGSRASITVVVVDCGKEHTFTGEIDTDGTHGDTFFQFPICSLDDFHVKSMTVYVGRRGVTITNPHAGDRYRYW